MTAEHTAYQMKLRRDCLKRASDLPLPDAVFEIVFYNKAQGPLFGRASSFEPLDMTILQQKYAAAEIEEWQQKAYELLRSDYALGDALLRKDGTFEPLEYNWKRANPGFSSNTYEKVISHGCFVAR